MQPAGALFSHLTKLALLQKHKNCIFFTEILHYCIARL